MLGLSTCWKSIDCDDGKEIIDSIVDLEVVDSIELEYRVSWRTFAQMRDELKGIGLKIASIHNFFPLPEGLPKSEASGDAFLLSSPDFDERNKALKYTTRTMEVAAELEVENIVLHLGRVEIEPDGRKLKELYERKELNSPAGKKLLERIKAERGKKKWGYVDSVFFCLDKLLKVAEKYSIYLCIENRYYLHEIPDFGEVGMILGEFRGGNIAYWHDVGHAAAQENMGLLAQKELLEAYGKMARGFHIHDVSGCKDHSVPKEDEGLDYDMIKGYMKSDALKIVEVHSHVGKQELLDYFRLLRGKGIG